MVRPIPIFFILRPYSPYLQSNWIVWVPIVSGSMAIPKGIRTVNISTTLLNILDW